MNVLGFIGASISIIAGLLGFFWPTRVSETVGLRIPSALGVSEFRATYGGLFIGGGLAVLLIQSGDAATVFGCGWAGAFIARAISWLIDKSHSRENVAGLVIEASIAALLLLS